MNALLDLENKLRTTGASIGRLEEEFAQRPTRGMQSNILSLRKLHANLQSEFDEAADLIGRDVCRYRMLHDRPSLTAFVASLGTFQDAFSQAFESIRRGTPRERRNLPKAGFDLSSLQVAYAFPGSFGMALTIPNSRSTLFPEMHTQLDRAANVLFDVVSSGASSSVIANAARTIGRAPISAIYDWANVNVAYETGAGIEWVRGDQTRANLIVQVPEFRSVSASIETIADTTTTEVSISGVLIGANTWSHRFHFLADETDENIHGSFTDAISDTQQAQLPSRYRAILKKTTEFRFATNTEKKTYFLERLERLPRIGDDHGRTD